MLTAICVLTVFALFIQNSLRDGTVIASCNGGHVSESIFEKENFNKELDSDVERELREALLEGRE